MDIYVGNLNFDLGKEQIRKLFEVFGPVDKVTLLKNKRSGRSRGKAFVVMPDAQKAHQAIKALDGRSIAGRNLRVISSHANQGKKVQYSEQEINHFDKQLPAEDVNLEERPKVLSSSQRTILDDGYAKVKFSE